MSVSPLRREDGECLVSSDRGRTDGRADGRLSGRVSRKRPLFTERLLADHLLDRVVFWLSAVLSCIASVLYFSFRLGSVSASHLTPSSERNPEMFRRVVSFRALYGASFLFGHWALCRPGLNSPLCKPRIGSPPGIPQRPAESMFGLGCLVDLTC